MVFDSSAYSEMNSLGNVAMVKDMSERDKMFDSRGWDAARFEQEQVRKFACMHKMQ